MLPGLWTLDLPPCLNGQVLSVSCVQQYCLLLKIFTESAAEHLHLHLCLTCRTQQRHAGFEEAAELCAQLCG